MLELGVVAMSTILVAMVGPNPMDVPLGLDSPVDSLHMELCQLVAKLALWVTTPGQVRATVGRLGARRPLQVATSI